MNRCLWYWNDYIFSVSIFNADSQNSVFKISSEVPFRLKYELFPFEPLIHFIEVYLSSTHKAFFQNLKTHVNEMVLSSFEGRLAGMKQVTEKSTDVSTCHNEVKTRH